MSEWPIAWQCLILAAGLFLVIKGGDWFVDSSVNIAAFFKIPRVVIGGTLVSLATTMPELVVSATASFMRDSGIAVGNAVGSAIANVALIVGLVALLSPVAMEKKDSQRRKLWLLGVMILFLILCWGGQITRTEAGVLFAVSIAYLIQEFYVVNQQKKKGKGPIFSDLESKISIKKEWRFFIAGATLVVIGSRLLVVSGITIAHFLNIPSSVIGLSIIAVGTSLPELVTALTAARKGVPDLSIGNITGANILNLAMIVGVSGIIYPLTLTRLTQMYSFPWLVVIHLFFIGSFFFRGAIGRKSGLLLLTFYGIYLCGLVILPLTTSLD